MESKIVEAVKKAIEGSKKRNFEESLEIAINLRDVDLSIPGNRIREEVLLPNGRGKPVKVAIFASGDLAVRSKKVADLVIPPEDLEDIAADKKKAKKIAQQYDFFLAEAPLMQAIGKSLGTVLAPRGKMPKPIAANQDPSAIIETLRNTVFVRSKSRRTFHAAVGTKSMSPEEIAENLDAVIKRVTSRLQRGRMNIASAYVKTTMGPAVRFM